MPQSGVVPPRAIPAGMTGDDLLNMMVDSGWRLDASFVCRACCQPAYLHPYTNEIWGCLTCGFTTMSVFIFFDKLEIKGGVL